jgi:hypothetical protein
MPCFFVSLTNPPCLLQELGRRETKTLRRSQGLSLNPSPGEGSHPTPLDVPPLPGRIEPGPKGRGAGDRKSAGKKSKMTKEAMKADSRSSVAILKSQEVDIDEEMDTAAPEDIESGSRREEAITARNNKFKAITAAVCVDALIFGLAFRSVSYSLSRSVFCKGTDPYLYLPDCLSVLVGFTFTNAPDPSSGTSVKSQARYLVFCWEARSGSALKPKFWSSRSSQ